MNDDENHYIEELLDNIDINDAIKNINNTILLNIILDYVKKRAITSTEKLSNMIIASEKQHSEDVKSKTR